MLSRQPGRRTAEVRDEAGDWSRVCAICRNQRKNCETLRFITVYAVISRLRLSTATRDTMVRDGCRLWRGHARQRETCVVARARSVRRMSSFLRTSTLNRQIRGSPSNTSTFQFGFLGVRRPDKIVRHLSYEDYWKANGLGGNRD